MSIAITRNKSGHKAQWIAFAVAVALLALAAYTSSHRDTGAVQMWSADSSWKGGWSE